MNDNCFYLLHNETKKEENGQDQDQDQEYDKSIVR